MRNLSMARDSLRLPELTDPWHFEFPPSDGDGSQGDGFAPSIDRAATARPSPATATNPGERAAPVAAPPFNREPTVPEPTVPEPTVSEAPDDEFDFFASLPAASWEAGAAPSASDGTASPLVMLRGHDAAPAVAVAETGNGPFPANGYNVVAMQETGANANRIDIVFLGDGYRSSELGTTYATQAQALVDHLFTGGQLSDPFGPYKNFFNIYRVDVVSNQSGTDDPITGTFVDTALDSSFAWNGGVDRLLYFDTTKAEAVLSAALAGTGIAAEIKFGVVNTAKYGGGGGSWGVYAGGNANALDVALHEIGHSFAGLADEYSYGGAQTYSGPEIQRPNVTTDPTGAKWTRWLGYDQPGIGTIGAYEGGFYAEFGVWRPSFGSKMRTLDQPFDAIGREQFILEFYDLVDPLDGHTGNLATLVDPGSLEVDRIDPSIIDVRWSYDGVVLADGDVGAFDPDDWNRPSGSHQVTALAYDPTDWVRVADRSSLQQEVVWSISLQHATMRASDTVHSLTGGTFTDTMVGSAAADSLYGAGGEDPLFGNGGNDLLYGDAGNDIVRGGDGNDVLDGGAGVADWADYIDKTVAVALTLNGTTDVAVKVNGVVEDTIRNIERVQGGSGDDLLYGDGLTNELRGQGGTDILRGGGGNDQLDGGAGVGDWTDYIDKTASVSVTLNGATNAAVKVNGVVEDTIRNIERVQGGSGDDLLYGDGLANELRGLGGTDILRGGGGNDVLDGGAGAGDWADYIDKTVAVAVTLNGATNAIVKVNGLNEDTIRNVERVQGGSGDDLLYGDGLANELRGLSGTDILRGGGANDLLDGGAGVADWADYADKTLAVAVTLNGATNAIVKVNGLNEDTISNVERVQGGSGDDLLYGDGLANELRGQGGNDILRGGGGNDVLDGGVGVADWADYIDKTVAVAVTLNGATNVTVTVNGVVEDTIRNIERAQGGSGDDVLQGDGLANELRGQGGTDILRGGGGNDVLDGGGGVADWADYVDKAVAVAVTLNGAANAAVTVNGVVEDTIRNIERVQGGSGNDVLNGDGLANELRGQGGNDVLRGGGDIDRLDGGIGNDTVQGGGGNDTVIGGTGADRFLFSAGDGNDRFTDFSAAQGDKVDLSGVTVSNIVNNVATLSDGSVLTAQAGYVWTGADFI